MSGAMMDNKPLLPASAVPKVTATEDDATAHPASALASLATSFPNSPAAARKFSLRNAFVGDDGIYAVPRWLIYLAMAWIIFRAEGWLEFALQSHLNAVWWPMWPMMIEARLMLAAIVPGFVMARIEGRPFGEFGLPARRAFGRNFWLGTLWGIGSLSVLMLGLRFGGVFQLGSFSLHGARLMKFAAYYALFFLFTGLFEEFLMRGYSQWILSRGVNYWPAAILLSIVFGAIHGANPGEAKTGLVAAGSIGLFLCLTLRRTGDLWWAVGFHTAWDWGESYLYSVPDSGTMLPGHLLNSSLQGPTWLTGGSVGPEGSYLVFVVIGALWVVFDRAYMEVKYNAS